MNMFSYFYLSLLSRMPQSWTAHSRRTGKKLGSRSAGCSRIKKRNLCFFVTATWYLCHEHILISTFPVDCNALVWRNYFRWPWYLGAHAVDLCSPGQKSLSWKVASRIIHSGIIVPSLLEIMRFAFHFGLKIFKGKGMLCQKLYGGFPRAHYENLSGRLGYVFAL